MIVSFCVKSFDRAVELDPNRLFALVQAGKLNAQTGDSDASLHCFNQALSIDANYPPALLGMAEALLASCRRYLRMGVAKIAASLANEARKLAERCTKFHGNLKVSKKADSMCMVICYDLSLNIRKKRL